MHAAFRQYLRISSAASFALALLLPRPLGATNGFSVSAHWEGNNNLFYMGFGCIVRHDIRSDTVFAHQTIYPGPARWPVVDQTGGRVAFITADARIVVVSKDGGEGVEVAANLVDAEGYLDWPEGDWIYYSRGGCRSFGSEEIWRAHARTGEKEPMAVFVRQYCDCRVAQWDWSLNADATRAVFRSADERLCDGTGYVIHALMPPAPYSEIELSCHMGYQSCGNAISPSGETVVAFEERNWDHNVFVVKDFSSRQTLARFTVDSLGAWAGRYCGTSASHTRWSANCDEWICAMPMDHVVGKPKANHMLVNWVRRKAILVTSNIRRGEGETSTNDGPGDFWVDNRASTGRGGAAPRARSAAAMRATGYRLYDLRGRAISAVDRHRMQACARSAGNMCATVLLRRNGTAPKKHVICR